VVIEIQDGFLTLPKRPLLWFPRIIFCKGEIEMAKYAVHTKWSWPDGVPSAETMQGWHRGHKSNTKAEDIIWFKIDENTHQSVIIYSSETDAQEERAKLQEQRKKDTASNGASMVEETMGPILSIMSEA
jgi:hypothetical protein